MDQAKFVLDIGIKSIDPLTDGSLLLRGYASVFTQDRDRETVQPGAIKTALEAYMTNPILLWQHNAERPIGFIRQAFVDAKGLMVDAVVPAPAPGSEPWHVKAFHDLKAGLVRCFSIGGLFRKQAANIIGMDLMEISCVSVPANPSAIFEVVQKAFDLEATLEVQPVPAVVVPPVAPPAVVTLPTESQQTIRLAIKSLDADFDVILARP